MPIFDGNKSITKIFDGGVPVVAVYDGAKKIWPPQAAIKQVVAGYLHSVAVREDGRLLVAGSNSYGQLGLGDTVDRNTWTLVPGITDVKEVACGGYHTILLHESGEVSTTGYGAAGQLAQGDTTNRSAFTKVTTGHKMTPNSVSRVLAGFFSSYIVRLRTIYGAGIGGMSGSSLYPGYHSDYQNPENNINVLFRSCGYRTQNGNTSELAKNVVHASIGSNAGHVLVDPAFTDSYGATFPKGLYGGGTSTYGVIGWPSNYGSGGPFQSYKANVTSSPIFPVSGGDIRTFETGTYVSLAINTAGQLYGSGQKRFMGMGTSDTSEYGGFSSLTGMTNCGKTFTRYESAFVLKQDGTLLGTGTNSNGELGVGNLVARYTWVAPQGLPENAAIVAVSPGLRHTLILDDRGRVFAAGGRQNGQLGDGITGNTDAYKQLTFKQVL